MDTLERDDCAIRNFEAVLEEREAPRGLVTDAMLRLLALYDDAGDADGRTAVLRRFWEVGMHRRSLGHVPYGLRFVPREIDVVVHVDVAATVAAPVWSGLGFDAPRYALTCDPAERRDLIDRHRWRRAERKAKAQGRTTAEVLYEEMDARAARPSPRPPRGAAPPVEPLFGAAACPLAEALGADGLDGWSAMTGGMSHRDFAVSMGIVQIPGLERKAAAAASRGRLRAVGPGHWVLVDFAYAGRPVHVARTDRDEVVIARDDMIDAYLAAHRRARARWQPDLERLVREVPRDASFFAVLTERAMQGLGFREMSPARRRILQALLPRPRGLQVAGIAYADLGVFTRMPTDNPVKGRAMVQIARRLVDGRMEADADAAVWLRDLDLAEASDGRALLASYVLPKHRILRVLWD